MTNIRVRSTRWVVTVYRPSYLVDDVAKGVVVRVFRSCPTSCPVRPGMGDRLRAGIPFRHLTRQLGQLWNSALHSSVLSYTVIRKNREWVLLYYFRRFSIIAATEAIMLFLFFLVWQNSWSVKQANSTMQSYVSPLMWTETDWFNTDIVM